MIINKIDAYRWEIPKTGIMNVPGRIFSSEKMIQDSAMTEALKQVTNVAALPGIQNVSMAMPDFHWGYGFPIGGVAAFDWKEGIVSPGGVGYDINCGVRLAASNLTEKDVRPYLEELIEELFRHIPCGVGSTGSIKLTKKEEKKVLQNGSRWAVNQGFGQDSDVAHTEDSGCLAPADPSEVSDNALERGLKQLGTLGSGNHFLEIDVVDEIFDTETAHIFGLFEN